MLDEDNLGNQKIMSQLEQILKNLKEKSEVDALFVAGSQGSGEQMPYSDIDTVIILKENPDKLTSLFQWIDDKPGDIYFFDSSDIERITMSSELPANNMDSVLIDWLNNAEISFDKSGSLTKLKNKTEDLKKNFVVPVSEAVAFDRKINYGYVRNKRYFDSGNPLYHEALRINLLHDVSNVLVGYFEFRNIPWRGEKFAVKYLKDNDMSFYNNFISFFDQPDLTLKYESYSRLVKNCFYADYQLWSKETIVPNTKDNFNEEKNRSLIDFWRKLVS